MRATRGGPQHGDPQGSSSEGTQREGALCNGRKGRTGTREQAAAKTAVTVTCSRYVEGRRRRRWRKSQKAAKTSGVLTNSQLAVIRHNALEAGCLTALPATARCDPPVLPPVPWCLWALQPPVCPPVPLVPSVSPGLPVCPPVPLVSL
jgi:hypothetical protein